MNTLSFNPASILLTGSDTLSQILDYAWLIVLGVLILFAVIYALVALWKGVYKTTLKFILMGIAFVCLIFFMPQIVNSISTFDLSTFGGGFDIGINGVNYHFGILDEVLADILINNELVSASSVGELYKAAIVLSHSIIGFAVYFIGTILILILVPFISALLYHCIFKFFIPKVIRKKHKLRFVSMIEGLICGTVAMTLFISPLSSLVGQVAKQDDAYNTLVEKGIIPENYKQYTDVLMSYDDSILYKTMTMGAEDPSKGIDAQLMEKVTKVIINGETYSIYEEIENLMTMVPAIAGNLEFIVDSSGNTAINLTKLLQVTSIDALLSTVSSSNLLSLILPILIDMGVNSVDISAEGQRLNFDDVDWSTELTALSDMYEAFYNAGLIDSALQVAVNNGDFEIDLTKVDVLKTYFETTLNDKDNILAKNLPVLLAYFAKTLNVPFIPTSPSVYETIDFGTEISTLLDVVYGLLGVVVPDVDNDGKIKLTSEAMSSIPDKLLNIIQNPLVPVDPSQPEGEKKTSEEYMALRNLITGTDEKPGLLNLQLVKNNIFKLDKILKSFLSEVEEVNKFIDDATYSKISEFITDPKEIGTLLDAAASIMELANGFDISKAEDREKISSILDKLSDSAIFKDIIPGLLHNVLAEQKDFSEMLFGIEIADLDFECKDENGNSILVDELNKILDIVDAALKIVNVMNDPNNTDATKIFQNLDTSLLKTVLLGVYNSKIINPVKLITSTNGVKHFEKNVNFNKLITGILSQQAIIDAGIVIPENLSDLNWYSVSSDNVESGEIINLLNAVDELKKNTFLLDPSFDIGTLTDEQLNGLSALLNTISQCKLIENSLPSILNNTVGPTITAFFGEGTNVKINFYNVVDWASETEALVNIIKKTKALNGGSFDFSSIDFASFVTSENEDQLTELLTAIADCSLFGVHQLDNGYYSDNFGELLYGTIDSFGMEDILGSGIDHNLFTSVTDKRSGTFKEGFWTGPDTNTSEIRKIAHMIIEFNKANNEIGAGGFAGGSIDPSLLVPGGLVENVLFSCMDTRSFSGVIKGAVENIIKDVTIMEGSNAVSLKLINLDELTKEDITLLLNLYSKSSSLQDMFGGGTVKIDNESIISIAELLNDIVTCDLFTTVKDGELYSMFDELMASILNISKLDTLILGLDETNPNLRAYTLLKVDEIDNWGALDSTKFNEWKALINSTSPTLPKAFNYEELRVAANASNSELLRIMNILKIISVSDIDYSNLSNISDLGTETINNVLNSINDSHLVHRAIPNLFDNIFNSETGMNLDEYTVIKDNSNHVLRSYEITTRVHVDYSEENRLYWKHEIDCVTRLYDALVKLGGTGKPDLGHIKLDADNFDSYSVIEPIAHLNIFDNCKHAILYNVLNKVEAGGQGGTTINIMDYIRGNDPLEKANLLKSYYFPVNVSDDYLKKQCMTIDGLIKEISTGFIEVKSSVSAERLTNLILASYTFDVKSKDGSTTHYNEKYMRGYLSQELVAGLLSDSFVAAFPGDADFFNTLFRNPNYRCYDDFVYLNGVELNGIKGLFKLVEAATINDLLSNPANLNKCLNLIEEGFKLMGRNKPASSVYDDTDRNEVLLRMNEKAIYGRVPEYGLYVNKAGTDPLANSIIAKKLIFEYASDIVIIPAQPPFVPTDKTLADLMNEAIEGDSTLDFRDCSFEFLGQKVVQKIRDLIASIPHP